MRVDISIGGDQLDLFKDENIDVVSSVADIEDITKNTTDYTKTFTVPASKENNKLFKHWYNANIDNSFDARVKVDGEIKLDGMLFRKGKFRLSKVSVKKGYPSSYTINFWGNLVSLKDVLGNDELSDLDLSFFDHSYDSDNVDEGLTTSLFGGDIIYNLFVKKQYFYNSDITNTNEGNIAWGDGSGSNGVIWNDLQPSLKIIKIIEAIENEYNLTFSRDFFGRSEFIDLYFWLNNSKGTDFGLTSQVVDWTSTNSPFMDLGTNISTYPGDETIVSNFKVIPSLGYENVQYTIRQYTNDSVQYEKEFQGTKTITTLIPSGQVSSVFYEILSSQEFKYTSNLKDFSGSGSLLGESDSAENTITSEIIISISMPKLKIIDFLKGLFNMFKLVVIPEDDGSLYIDTFNSFYASGGVFDITRYIDYNSYDVERGKMLKEINYLFSEPTSILNKQFEENTGIAYGDAEIKLTDDNGEPLDGDDLKFTLPFEQIVYERLTDQNDNELTNAQYGAIIDESLSPVNPKLHLFYNINQSIGVKTIGFINDLGIKENLTVNINTPSHTIGLETSNFSTVFNSEFSTWSGEKINNTLYANYHEDYVLSIFNVKKRSFKYKVKNLPLRIMLDLELNDLLKIRDTFYRINKFTTNLLSGEVSFDLINSFTDTINSFTASPSSFLVFSDEQQISSNITNLNNFITNKIDNGFGTDWVTISTIGNNMYFDLDKNIGETFRDIFIDVTNTDTLQEVRIYINQEAGSILSSNNTVTADTDLTTADNV